MLELFAYFVAFTVGFSMGTVFGVGVMACLRAGDEYDKAYADMLDDAGYEAADPRVLMPGRFTDYGRVRT